MEYTIDNKKYQFKEYLTFAEEGDVDILTSIFPIIIKHEKDTNDSALENEILSLINTKDFRSKSLKLIHYMALDPKLEIAQINDMKSTDVLNLMIACLKAYIQSFTSGIQKKS